LAGGLLVGQQQAPICNVILWRDLEAETAGLAEWSYVAPITELEACRARLHPDSTIMIQPAEGDGQLIRLTSSPGGDEVNSSEYRATPGAMEPISHQMYFGPIVSLVAAGISGLCGSILGAFGVWRYGRRRASA
jgi:hypothetical protein